MKKVITYSLESIDTIVELLDELRKDVEIFTFTGNLGTGKTTLIKRLLARAGVDEVITSPTFTIVAQYKNEQGQKFNHFDLYRLASLKEFMDEGLHEYLYESESCSYIEWPELILPLLTHNVCHCRLEHVSPSERKITIET